MAKNVDKIARRLGARFGGKVPDVGGGAFGAARLAAVLQARLRPGAGRPTDPDWVKHPKVPMSDATFQRLQRLADELSTPERRVSPMQVAAQLLEDSVGRVAPREE